MDFCGTLLSLPSQSKFCCYSEYTACTFTSCIEDFVFLGISKLLFTCIDLTKKFQLFDPGSSGFFHISHPCWGCNCYQWWFSSLQIMNINMSPRAPRLDLQVTAGLFQLLLVQLSLKLCHFIFYISYIASRLEEYDLLSSSRLQVLGAWRPIAGTVDWTSTIMKLIQSFPHQNNFFKFCGKFFINSFSLCLIHNWKIKLVSNLWSIQCPVFFCFCLRLY